MSVDLFVGSALVVILTAYLIAALLHPEKF